MQPQSGVGPADRTIANGRYRLLHELGSGGMATVWRCHDEVLDCERAIKILLPAMAAKQKVRVRFDNEARTMAKLTHPNIVTVHDIGCDVDRPFIVMELLDGGSAMGWVERHGPMPPRMGVELTIAVLQALHAAHLKGVVHRDIKPHNILISADGVAKVTDFGIAQVRNETDQHLTRTGMVMGTWAYMAPEQKQSAKEVDARGDIYAVAASLFALLTGQEPFDLYATEMHDEVAAKVALPIAEIIRKGTRFRPDDRYPTAAAMAEALKVLLPSLPEIPSGTPPLAEVILPTLAEGGRVTTLHTYDSEASSAPAAKVREISAPPSRVVPATSAGPTYQGGEPAGPRVPNVTVMAEPPPAPATSASIPGASSTAAMRERGRSPMWLLGGLAVGAVALVGVGVVLAGSLGGAAVVVASAPADEPPVVATAPLPTPPVTLPLVPATPPPDPGPVAAVAPPSSPPVVPPVPANTLREPVPKAPPPKDPPKGLVVVTAVAPVPPTVAPASVEKVRVVINAIPYAFVAVDGVAAGRTAYSGQYAAGPHTVTFEAADGRKATINLEVTGPETRYCYNFAKAGPC